MYIHTSLEIDVYIGSYDEVIVRRPMSRFQRNVSNPRCAIFGICYALYTINRIYKEYTVHENLQHIGFVQWDSTASDTSPTQRQFLHQVLHLPGQV